MQNTVCPKIKTYIKKFVSKIMRNDKKTICCSVIWKVFQIFIQTKFKINSKISQVDQASISTRNLAAKKVNPTDTSARVLENFIVIHLYVYYADWRFFLTFYLSFFIF